MMQMEFYWGCRCIFLIESLETTDQQCNAFSIYLLVTFILTLATDMLSFLKVKVLKQRELLRQENSGGALELLALTLQTIYIASSGLIMLLVMTFNWWVFLTVCLAKLIVYVIFKLPADTEGKVSTEADERFNMCCH